MEKVGEHARNVCWSSVRSVRVLATDARAKDADCRTERDPTSIDVHHPSICVHNFCHQDLCGYVDLQTHSHATGHIQLHVETGKEVVPGPQAPKS